jgi:hypothetical protein
MLGSRAAHLRPARRCRLFMCNRPPGLRISMAGWDSPHDESNQSRVGGVIGRDFADRLRRSGMGQSRGGARRSGGMSRAPMARFVPRVASLRPSYVRLNAARGSSLGYNRQAAIRITRDRFGRLHRVRIIAPIFFSAGYLGYYPYIGRFMLVRKDGQVALAIRALCQLLRTRKQSRKGSHHVMSTERKPTMIMFTEQGE